MNTSVTDNESYNQALFDYLDNAPTPFHAISESVKRLEKSGFVALSETEEWELKEGTDYYVVRNGSSLIAFHYAHKDWAGKDCRLVGAHSDSPCLKVKPNALSNLRNYLKVGVEVYGGVLLNPWFDRDLSLAGRVVVEDSHGKQYPLLINFKKPIAYIPSLAIHLDREANQNRSVNAQKDVCPVLMQVSEEGADLSFQDILLEQLKKQHPDQDIASVADFELSFYDVQKAATVGLREQFITSARLDNLLSCFTAIEALCAVEGDRHNTLVVINDHEEVGSQTAHGAQGTFLTTALERICGGSEKAARCLASSMLVSADNAHGIHPNFPEKHDANHGPILNEGVVIKLNANQRYATNSLTSARFKKLASKAGEKAQSFVVRSDMACGSTIGPLTAAELGIQTVDVGVPTFAMHSIREIAGSRDCFSLYRILKLFFEEQEALDHSGS